MSFLETLYRQCLSDGTWFSCPSLQDDNGGNRVGWTNYSLCWTETTKKLMEDLNQTPSCPDEASEEAKEVCVKQFSKYYLSISTHERPQNSKIQ